MKSIYEKALGEDFNRLHPKMKDRFRLTSESGVAQIGRGVMDSVWHGPYWTCPFLFVGSYRRIMFPEYGRDIPFTIRNYAYRDDLGRETVTWIREFATRKPRRFDAYMIFSEERGRIVDYLGTHQHLAVDLELSVTDRGGLRLFSGEQRFYEGRLAFRFPMLFSGIAEVEEWFDEASGKYRINVLVKNNTWGKLFGYSGSFDVETLSVDSIPPDLFPVRVERRE